MSILCSGHEWHKIFYINPTCDLLTQAILSLYLSGGKIKIINKINWRCMMELQITTFFVLSDELMKSMNIRENSQIKMNNAEVMTVILTAARFFGGHIENARNFLKEHGYVTDMLSESRLNRRIHAIDDSVWQNLFTILSETVKRDKRRGWLVS
jgi:hypothetical protein